MAISNKTVSEQDVRDILQKICDLTSRPRYCSYAISYARAGLHMSGTELKAQVPYVLYNLQYWRGDEAREAKKKLKAFIKGGK